MSLTSGTRVGPYEIVSPLGAGGMGEVYRARDSKLGRDVALKILPALFAADPERLARFEREAKTRRGRPRNASCVSCGHQPRFAESLVWIAPS